MINLPTKRVIQLSQDLEINFRADLVTDLMTNTSLCFMNNLVEDLVGNNFGDLFVTNRKVPEPHDFPLLLSLL